MPTNPLLTSNSCVRLNINLSRLLVTSLFHQNSISCVWASKDIPETKKTMSNFENPVSIKKIEVLIVRVTDFICTQNLQLYILTFEFSRQNLLLKNFYIKQKTPFN